MRILLLPILLPLALLYFLGSYLRSRFYDLGILKSYGVSARVICVGNLTSGGTGKTPLVTWLANELSKRSRVVVLSRGYGRSSQQTLRVDPQSQDVCSYGDEPLQLARQLDVPVYVGADRVQAAQKIMAVEKPDIILLDDGFQHRRLKRDIDLLVVDSTQPRWHYWPLPLGFAREGKWAFKRATAVAVTKVNLGQRTLQIPESKKTFSFTSNIVSAKNLNGQSRLIEYFRGQKAALLSAIGRPEIFEKQMSQAGINVILHKKFSDHHQFTSTEISNFLNLAGGADVLFVTEKDAVKLSAFDLPRDRVFVTELAVNIIKERDELDRLLNGFHT